MPQIIKKGSRGPEVSEWQNFLRGQGFAAVAVSGEFDEATDKASREFQGVAGLRQDGIVGPNTLKAAAEKGFHIHTPPERLDNLSKPKMRVSDKGRAFIKSFEREILKIYDDGYGFPTGGIGHRLTGDELDRLPLGTPISKLMSDVWFEADLKSHTEPIDRLVKVPLTQGQYDALASLVFNIGGENFRKSSLLKALNEKRYDVAKAKFDDWIKSDGRVSRGLVRRRNEEQEMWDRRD